MMLCVWATESGQETMLSEEEMGMGTKFCV